MIRKTILLVAACAAATGCSRQLPEPEFVFQKATQDLHQVMYGKFDSPRNAVAEAVKENFGTPNKLVVWQVFPIDYGEPEPASADATHHVAGWKLKEGRDLYMVHCVHCHGTSGDGNGPTARFLNPLPRDYRLGKFKFTSTEGGLKPSRHDLKTILANGIPGTSMPTFVLLGEERMDRLVEYVRFLSMRGDYEIRVGQLVGEFASADAVRKARNSMAESALDKAGKKPEGAALQQAIEAEAARENTLTAVEQEIVNTLNSDQERLFVEPATDVAQTWNDAENPENVVQPREATVLKGAKLLEGVEPRPVPSEKELPAGRVKLVGQTGKYWQVATLEGEELGYVHAEHLEARTGIDASGRPTAGSLKRGRELFLSDEIKCYDCHGYGGRGDGPQTEAFIDIPLTNPARKYEKPGLHDDWGQLIQPRNLTRNIFRGGRRPIDIYRRLRVGIKGTPMQGFTTGKFKGQPLTDDDFWALVNYVTAIPFESTAAPEGKDTHKVAKE